MPHSLYCYVNTICDATVHASDTHALSLQCFIDTDKVGDAAAHACDTHALSSQCYIDTVGDADSYERRLRNMFPSIDFVVCKKADSIYPITSAASICAKVRSSHESSLCVVELFRCIVVCQGTYIKQGDEPRQGERNDILVGFSIHENFGYSFSL